MGDRGNNALGAFAVKGEASYGDAAFPASGDFLPMADGITMEPTYGNPPVPDYNGVSLSEFGALQDLHQVNVTIPLIGRGSGTGGTPSFLQELFENTGFGAATNNTADTIQASPSPTTTSGAIGTPGNVTANTFISFTDLSGEKKPLVRFCTANSSGTLTWTPALPAAPASGDAVAAASTWAPKVARDESLAVWRWGDSKAVARMLQFCAPGFAPNSYTLSWDLTSSPPHLRHEWSGEASGQWIATGTTTLGAAIANGTDTSITLTELGVVTVGSIIAIESEALQVTAKSADTGTGTCTVVRGFDSTTGAAHSDSTAVTPYRPAVTVVTEEPIPGNYCDVHLGTTTTQFPATAGSITITQNVAIEHDSLQDGGAGSNYSAGKRRVEVSLTGYFDTDTQLEAFKGLYTGSSPFLAVWGRQAGRMFAAYSPKLYWNATPFNLDGDSGTMVTLTGTTRATSGEDEIYIGEA